MIMEQEHIVLLNERAFSALFSKIFQQTTYQTEKLKSNMLYDL